MDQGLNGSVHCMHFRTRVLKGHPEGHCMPFLNQVISNRQCKQPACQAQAQQRGVYGNALHEVAPKHHLPWRCLTLVLLAPFLILLLIKKGFQRRGSCSFQWLGQVICPGNMVTVPEG